MTFSRVVLVVASLLIFLVQMQAGSAPSPSSSAAAVAGTSRQPARLIPPPPPPPLPPDGNRSSQATLVLQTDAPCSFSIAEANDEITNGDVPVGGTVISVPPGETTIICSASDPGVEGFSDTVTATAGQRVLVNIQLAAAIAARQKAQQQRCDAEADKTDPDGRFQAAAAGALIDSQTGLQWTQADNGRPINWKQASRYCAAMKGGWRLPTIDELSGLYSSCVSQKCFAAGGAQFICHVSSRFRLTGISYWSSQSKDSAMAYAVGFEGDKAEAALGIASDADEGERALCARRP